MTNSVGGRRWAIQEIPGQYSKEIADVNTDQATVDTQAKVKLTPLPCSGSKTQVTYYVNLNLTKKMLNHKTIATS